MPIYEYRCASCGHELEVIQKVSDTPLTECESCGELSLKKLISPVGFRLKGSGWYETDFKTGDKKKNLAGDDKPAEKSTDGDAKKAKSAENKTESKPKSDSTSASSKAA